MTDFLLPHAVLQRAGVADVHAVAPRRGRVLLYPALQVEVAQDLAGFDRAHPAGADYVIVPAMQRRRRPCDHRVAEAAGRSRARASSASAPARWSSAAPACSMAGGSPATGTTATRCSSAIPSARYVPHQRYVVDRGVATTTGITASVPTMLALVEAIGGRDKAQALAAELGVDSWSPAHDSSRFRPQCRPGVELCCSTRPRSGATSAGVSMCRTACDDIALALAADAWSRTGRVSVDARRRGSRDAAQRARAGRAARRATARRACRSRRRSSRCSSSTARCARSPSATARHGAIGSCWRWSTRASRPARAPGAS